MKKLFKALSHENRLKILKFLLEKEDFTCVCELEKLIDRDRSVIYRHFRKLVSAGVLETRKEGLRVEARVKNPEKIKKLFEISKEVTEYENRSTGEQGMQKVLKLER